MVSQKPCNGDVAYLLEWQPREGVIIECSLIHLFYDARGVILTSRNDVRGIPSDDNDNEMLILTIKRR